VSRFPLPVGLSRGLQRALLETVPLVRSPAPQTPARRGRPPGSKNKRQGLGCASAPVPCDRLLEALQQHHPRRSVALHQSGGALR